LNFFSKIKSKLEIIILKLLKCLLLLLIYKYLNQNEKIQLI